LGTQYSLTGSCLMVDPKLHKFIDVWVGAFEGLADKLETQFPDEEERREFGKAMARDLANPAYRLFTWV